HRLDPAIRVTTLARTGCDSRISDTSPTSDNLPATYSAAARSPGPAPSPYFPDSMRLISRQSATTSASAALVFGLAFMPPSCPQGAVHAPGARGRGAKVGGLPGPRSGSRSTCARVAELADALA